MKALAARLRFPFPYLWDESQEVAKAYGAVCTPDFFGYNADLKLHYRGRLDELGTLAEARRAARAFRRDGRRRAHRQGPAGRHASDRLLDQVARCRLIRRHRLREELAQRIEHRVGLLGHQAVAAVGKRDDAFAPAAPRSAPARVLRRRHEVALRRESSSAGQRTAAAAARPLA